MKQTIVPGVMVACVLLAACAGGPVYMPPDSSYKGPLINYTGSIRVATKPTHRVRCEETLGGTNRTGEARPEQQKAWITDLWPAPNGYRRVTRYLRDTSLTPATGTEVEPLYASDITFANPPAAASLPTIVRQGERIYVEGLADPVRARVLADLRGSAAASHVIFNTQQGVPLRVSDANSRARYQGILQATDPSAQVTTFKQSGQIMGLTQVRGRTALVSEAQEEAAASVRNGTLQYKTKGHILFDRDSGLGVEMRRNTTFTDGAGATLLQATAATDCTIEPLTGNPPAPL